MECFSRKYLALTVPSSSLVRVFVVKVFPLLLAQVSLSLSRSLFLHLDGRCSGPTDDVLVHLSVSRSSMCISMLGLIRGFLLVSTFLYLILTAPFYCLMVDLRFRFSDVYDFNLLIYDFNYWFQSTGIYLFPLSLLISTVLIDALLMVALWLVPYWCHVDFLICSMVTVMPYFNFDCIRVGSLWMPLLICCNMMNSNKASHWCLIASLVAPAICFNNDLKHWLVNSWLMHTGSMCFIVVLMQYALCILVQYVSLLALAMYFIGSLMPYYMHYWFILPYASLLWPYAICLMHIGSICFTLGSCNMLCWFIDALWYALLVQYDVLVQYDILMPYNMHSLWFISCFMIPQPYGCMCVGDERNPRLITCNMPYAYVCLSSVNRYNG